MYETYKIKWDGISITVEFAKCYSPAYKEIQGHGMSHIRIKRDTKGQLPISETGDRSRFIPLPQIEEYGDVKNYVTTWLDHSGKFKKWKDYIADERQLKLF